MVASYNNGQSANNEIDSIITYTARVPVVGLTISGNSNPNFNFSSTTTQPTNSSLVTLTNSGSRPLNNLSWDLPAQFSTSVDGVTNACGSTLAAGSSCNVSLIYTNGTVTAPTQATAKVNYNYTGINQQEQSNSPQISLSYQTTQSNGSFEYYTCIASFW